MSPISSLRSSATRMLRDQAGNFGIVTALLAVPLILAAGLAVDYSTASVQRTHLQEISDGAALAGGKIFDGTNLSQAKAAAQDFVNGYKSQLPSDVLADITADGRILKVNLTGSIDTAFMKIASKDSVNIGATAAAVSPERPTKITLDPGQAQGYWYKVITVMVVRPNSTAEVSLATIVYQPTTQNDSGQGTKIVTPADGKIDLGNYTKLVLKMDVKKDGCPLGKHAQTVKQDKDKKVICDNSTASADKKYETTLRTDKPDQMDSLYVDGKQLKKGATYPLESYFGCNGKQSHAWEDGGGADRQDFFYTIEADCSGTEGKFVRLTQ